MDKDKKRNIYVQLNIEKYMNIYRYNPAPMGAPAPAKFRPPVGL